MIEEHILGTSHFVSLDNCNNWNIFETRSFIKKSARRIWTCFNASYANSSYRETKESVKRFSEKNEVFSELYVPLFSLYFFLSSFSFLSLLFTIFHSTYVLCYSTFLCLLFFSRTTLIYCNLLTFTNLYLSVFWSASPISWLTWHNFDYQTGITRAIAVAPVRTILNRRVGLGSVSVGRRSVGSLSLAGSLGTEILLAVLRTARVKICRPLYEKQVLYPQCESI